MENSINLQWANSDPKRNPSPHPDASQVADASLPTALTAVPSVSAAELPKARETDALPASQHELAIQDAVAVDAATLELSASQQAAIVHLTRGDSVIQAAAAAGVTRMTLYRWMKGDSAFKAAYNAWQQDAVATARARLLALTSSAVTTVGKSIESGNAGMALKLLQSLGLLTPPTPGPTEPAEVQRRQELKLLKRSSRLKHAEEQADFETMLP